MEQTFKGVVTGGEKLLGTDNVLKITQKVITCQLHSRYRSYLDILHNSADILYNCCIYAEISSFFRPFFIIREQIKAPGSKPDSK